MNWHGWQEKLFRKITYLPLSRQAILNRVDFALMRTRVEQTTLRQHCFQVVTSPVCWWSNKFYRPQVVIFLSFFSKTSKYQITFFNFSLKLKYKVNSNYKHFSKFNNIIMIRKVFYISSFLKEILY